MGNSHIIGALNYIKNKDTEILSTSKRAAARIQQLGRVNFIVAIEPGRAAAEMLVSSS